MLLHCCDKNERRSDRQIILQSACRTNYLCLMTNEIHSIDEFVDVCYMVVRTEQLRIT